MFVWIDTETTGLDEHKDTILSLGMIITTDNMKEVARAEWDVWAPQEDLARMSPYVREMHTKSGLLGRVSSPICLSKGDVYRSACAWLDKHLGPPSTSIQSRPPVAGNSVHFDVSFIKKQMPGIMARVHYRMLDVTSLKLLCMATVPGARAWEGARKGAAHTPLADLERSMAELGHWKMMLYDQGWDRGYKERCHDECQGRVSRPPTKRSGR